MSVRKTWNVYNTVLKAWQDNWEKIQEYCSIIAAQFPTLDRIAIPGVIPVPRDAYLRQGTERMINARIWLQGYHVSFQENGNCIFTWRKK